MIKTSNKDIFDSILRFKGLKPSARERTENQAGISRESRRLAETCFN